MDEVNGMNMKNQHKKCLICGSSDLHVLESYKAAHLSKCANCSFVFSNLKPTVQELEKHYEGYGRNDYLSRVTVKRYNELLDYFERFRKSNKILDIGCGIGYFLVEAQKRGWEVYGTEYTDAAIKICKSKEIHIQKGPLDANKYEAHSFDIVCSFEVIEHINNPVEELFEIKKILRKDGLVYVTTPNFNAIERYILKSKYNVICYPEHLSYYTARTLNNLFSSNGFESIRTVTTGISITRVLKSMEVSSENVVEKNNSDDIVRNLSESNFITKGVKHIINGLLNLTRLGNSLKGFYILKG